MNSIDLSHFPGPPVPPTAQLMPIESWYQMVQETQTTGVASDDFWLDRVIDGAACFFDWRGPARATVLAVWGLGRLRLVEPRTLRNRCLGGEHEAAIQFEVGRLLDENGLPAMEVLH